MSAGSLALPRLGLRARQRRRKPPEMETATFYREWCLLSLGFFGLDVVYYTRWGNVISLLFAVLWVNLARRDFRLWRDAVHIAETDDARLPPVGPKRWVLLRLFQVGWGVEVLLLLTG